jgi:hypothetical protein
MIRRHSAQDQDVVGFELKTYPFVNFLNFDDFGAIVGQNLSAIWGLLVSI